MLLQLLLLFLEPSRILSILQFGSSAKVWISHIDHSKEISCFQFRISTFPDMNLILGKRAPISTTQGWKLVPNFHENPPKTGVGGFTERLSDNNVKLNLEPEQMLKRIHWALLSGWLPLIQPVANQHCFSQLDTSCTQGTFLKKNFS